jgi:hypothetical protein
MSFFNNLHNERIEATQESEWVVNHNLSVIPMDTWFEIKSISLSTWFYFKYDNGRLKS